MASVDWACHFLCLLSSHPDFWSEFHSNRTRIDPTDLDGAGAGRVCTGPWYFQRRQVLVEGFLDCDPRVTEIKGVLVLYAVQYCT